MSIDWQAMGAAVAAVVLGVGSFIAGRGKRQVADAKADAEVDVVTLLRQEIERLSRRVEGLESREGRMVRHIYRLEGLMRAANPPIEPPPFDLDGVPVKAGGTE